MPDFSSISRRSFVKQTALATAATAFLPALSLSEKPKCKMGYQLFSIRDAMEQDPLGTIKKLAAMGYEDFEIYGFEPEKLGYYGFEAREFKSRLDDMGLTVTSGHYGLSAFVDDKEAMKRYVDRCILGAKALGTPYITWPWMPPEMRNLEGFKKLPEVLNAIGKQVTEAGLGFAYHNHNFEFEDFGGINGYDIITKQTDPKLVKLQIDMYWTEHSSPVSTVDLIARDPGRFVMWHIKDMDKVTRDYTELGNGSIDYHKLLTDVSMDGLQYFYIEQGGNYAHNSTRSAADSAAYFKKELRQYID